MTIVKQFTRIACSAVLGIGLLVAHVGPSAAGGYCSSVNSRSASFAQTIPIRISMSASSVASGSALSCTVTVMSVPANGGSVLIDCDTPSAFTSPDGNWPTSIYFAPGSSTTASFTLTANSVSSSTTVNLYYGTSDADPNNPDDWTAGGAVTVEAG